MKIAARDYSVRRRWARVAIASLALLLLIAAPGLAQAHPLGNFTVNHYSRLELTPGQLRIFYVLDMAEIPTFQTVQQLDRNGDGQISPAEGTAFAITKRDELRGNLRFTVNSAPIALDPDGDPDLSFPPGQGGLSLLRLTFALRAPLPTNARETLNAAYRDENDVGRIGWREIVVRGHDGVWIFNANVSDQDQSDELRSYPTDMLSSPLNQTSASFSFQPGEVSRNSGAAAQRSLGSAQNDGAFAALITLPQLSLSTVLLALVTALGLGALHALEPGHGKTVAAAFLIGSRATPRHAALLGLSVTVMHTSSVFVLGFVTLFLSRFILPERLLPWLGLGSGVIVIAMGLHMFFSRLRPGAATGHAQHAHDHAHDHSQPHTHGFGHHHSHPSLRAAKTSWRSVVAIGISGGLLPCPAALVVLLSAIGLGRVGFGLLLIVAFSAGLALVLSLIGIMVLYGERWARRFPPLMRIVGDGGVPSQFAKALPALSGLLVVGAGTLLLYHALPLLRIWQV